MVTMNVEIRNPRSQRLLHPRLARIEQGSGSHDSNLRIHFGMCGFSYIVIMSPDVYSQSLLNLGVWFLCNILALCTCIKTSLKMNSHIFWQCWFPGTLEERLQLAAKQQVRRLCTLKKKRKNLNPPDWLVEAYNKQDKTELAQMLVDANFDKDWVLWANSASVRKP